MFAFCIHIGAYNQHFLLHDESPTHTRIVSYQLWGCVCPVFHTSAHEIHLSVCMREKKKKVAHKTKIKRSTQHFYLFTRLGLLQEIREKMWNAPEHFSQVFQFNCRVVSGCWYNIYIRTTSICQLNKVYKYLSSVDFHLCFLICITLLLPFISHARSIQRFSHLNAEILFFPLNWNGFHVLYI